MNPFTASVFVGVVTILTVVSAQQTNCGCAAQPTIIQLSCGGGGMGSHHGGHVRPPAPPPHPGNNWGAAPSPMPNYPPTTPEEVMQMCHFDANGHPTNHPPGGFPAGFTITYDEHGNPNPILPPGFQFPTPPEDWDGTPETLGFDMPQPGTPLYNLLMCYPIPVITTGR